jgi:5'-nucleotidase
MNILGPDVVTLGNHEMDYGVGHLLFLEKCARFPIINANLYLKTNGIHPFESYRIVEIDGMKIMFIGIVTEEVLNQAKQERLVGSIVDVHEAAEEVGRICNAHKTDDIDFTVLLTHIGIADDKKLAEILDPSWGVDIIIGGHSHTFLEEPLVVNNIPIVQAVTGTDQIGRFDIVVNTDENCIDSYEWERIPIGDSHCPRDPDLEKLITQYTEATDKKYGRYITRLASRYYHPRRDRETQLGKIFADVFRDSLGLDVMFLASGSLRETAMGPIVQYRDLTQMFPYHDEIFRIKVTGKKLKEMIKFLFRAEAIETSETEFYQFSRGMKVVVSIPEKAVKEISFEGKPIDDDRIFRIGLQGFHFKSKEKFFGITEEESEKICPVKKLSTNAMDVLDENFSRMEIVSCPEDERWITAE